MRGLSQVVALANKSIVNHMSKYGHYPVNCANEVWKCKHDNIMLALVVDDFGVKMRSEQESKHLINYL